MTPARLIARGCIVAAALFGLAGCLSEPPLPNTVTKLQDCVKKTGLIQVIASAPSNDTPPKSVYWVVQYGDHDVPFDVGEHQDGPTGDLWIFRSVNAAKQQARKDDAQRMGNLVVVPRSGEVSLDDLRPCQQLAAKAGRIEPEQRYND